MSDLVYRAELTPVSFLRRSAAVFPDKTAVVHGERRVSYREFEERVNRLASRLRAAGLARHDRVAFLCPNTPALLEAHFAVPAAGGVLVAINTRLSSDEIGYILRHSGVRFLFVDAELEHLIQPLDTTGIARVRIDDTGARGDPYEDFLADGTPEPVDSWLEDELETISINYTSGTTGRPKGVMYTYRGAYLNALGQTIEMGMGAGSVFLWVLPMFHCNGWCLPWAVTAVGGMHVCLRRIDPGQVWDLFAAEGVTHYSGAPTVHIGMVNAPTARPLDRRITLTSGGSPPSPTLLSQLTALNLRPIHVYGLTETYGPTTVSRWQSEWAALPLESQARRLARQGHANIVAEPVRVVDDEMRDVPRDGETMGEVVMRGNIVMEGYFADPDATAEAFRGGWFHSGDLGVMHADGSIELRDRKKDIVISGGENISTIEVEQTLARHAAVLECAVIGIPDDKWGERPKAFVTLKPEHSVSAEELISFCREHLAHFKCPAAVEFGGLPKTSTGKVQKVVLRDRAGQRTPIGSTELTVSNRTFEMLRAVLGAPDAPVGITPKEVVWRKNKARVYRYTRDGPPTRRTPVFLVMPLINRAYILDLRPGASLVAYLLQQGFDVFMLDWGIPSDEDRDLSLDSMLTGYLARAVRRTSDLTGSAPLTLLGYSTGGTLAACFAALYPDGPVKNLVLFTTPIDFSDAGQLGRWSQTSAFPVGKLTEVFPTVPPHFMDLAMKLISPLPGTVGVYVRLWDRVGDPNFDVAGWQAMSRWVNDAVPFAAAAYRQWITEFYQHNKLAKGTLVLAGQRVRLERIRCPLLNVAGSADTITPRSTTRAVMQLVSSEDKEELVLKGGHVGILVGRAARTELWPRLVEWLEHRD